MTPQGIATVARQEFRLRIRAGRWRLLLGIWFAVLVLFTALLRAAVGGFNSEDIADKGVVVYGGLMLFVLGLALLVVPALAAQSVNGDRERGTLATLQVTRLTAGDITLGKFGAAWGTSLVFLVLTLPPVIYAMTQKGVPFWRTVVVFVVLSLLLGTICAISLALSALLSRTTTSGVLAYITVFALTLGTLITFALVTAMTSEEYTSSYQSECPTLESLPPNLTLEERQRIVSECQPGPQTFTTSRTRTDRTWWLLAPNPFVVLADAAPRLPPETAAERRKRQEAQARGEFTQSARDLDPLGSIGNEVRDLRKRPDDNSGGGTQILVPREGEPQAEPERKPVWPWGLAFDVLLAIGALVLTQRRLRTPTKNLPKGQRVA